MATSAADSHAPDGARLDWLPTDEWVMSSWLPYDEERLYALLRTDRAELSTWLNDRRGLGDLARARGHASLRRLLRGRAERAVRVGAMSRIQAAAVLRHQESGLRAYVHRPFRTLAQHCAFLCRVR